MIAQLNRTYISSRKTKVFSRLLSYFFFEGRPATTKGRWFNPVTFLTLRIASKSKIVDNAQSPVFITGTGRSGSTILGMILSIHKDVGFLNEPKALWYMANHSDDLIGSYSANGAQYMMKKDHATKDSSSFVHSAYSAFLTLTRTKKIVDKFPEMIFRIDYLNHLFQNPKYIFLYRNPRDTIASTALWSAKHGNESTHEDWWGVDNRKWNLLVEQVVVHDEMLAPFAEKIKTFTSQEDKAAVEWIVTMNQGIKMMAMHRNKFFPVRYEDLADNPAKSLLEISNFCGLGDDPVYLSFGVKTLKKANTARDVKIHKLLIQPIAILSEKLGYGVYSPSMTVTE